MYHSTILIHFPRSSLRTNKHTNRHGSLINIEGLGLRPSMVTAAVRPRFLSPFPFSNARINSPSPYLLLFLFTKNNSLSLLIDSNMRHLNQPSNSIIYQQAYLPTYDVSSYVYTCLQIISIYHRNAYYIKKMFV